MPTPCEVLKGQLPAARTLGIMAESIRLACINSRRTTVGEDMEKVRVAAREAKRLAGEIEKALEG